MIVAILKVLQNMGQFVFIHFGNHNRLYSPCVYHQFTQWFRKAGLGGYLLLAHIYGYVVSNLSHCNNTQRDAYAI